MASNCVYMSKWFMASCFWNDFYVLAAQLFFRSFGSRGMNCLTFANKGFSTTKWDHNLSEIKKKKEKERRIFGRLRSVSLNINTLNFEDVFLQLTMQNQNCLCLAKQLHGPQWWFNGGMIGG